MTHLSVEVKARPDGKGLPTFTRVHTAAVVFLPVHSETVPTRVGLAAVFTAIRFFASVAQHVFPQSSCNRKPGRALFALKWLLTRVDAHVFLETVALVELQLAHAASKTLDALVNGLDVHFERMGRAEPVGALVAAELLPKMFLHVPPQPWLPEELGTADLALLRLFPMAERMLPEAGLVLEGFVAGRECAREGALFVVVGHVVVEVRFVLEHFATLWAQGHRLDLLLPQVPVEVPLKAAFRHGGKGLVALGAKPGLLLLMLSHVLADLAPRGEGHAALRAALLVAAGLEMVVEGVEVWEGFPTHVACVDPLAIHQAVMGFHMHLVSFSAAEDQVAIRAAEPHRLTSL